jgi:tRNA_anti-like
MKSYVKITLFIVLAIVLIAILTALIEFNKKHADTAKVRPDFVITATTLQKEFEDNEKAASARYINKILEVSGTIASAVPSDSAHLNISLKTGSEISSVNCVLTAAGDMAKLKPGLEITLRGECSGFLMDVLLKNCAIIKKRK